MQFVPVDNCYAYFRYNEDSKIMVVINNNPEAQTLDLTRFDEMLNGNTKGREVLTDTSITLSENLKIEGKTSLIIDLD